MGAGRGPVWWGKHGCGPRAPCPFPSNSSHPLSCGVGEWAAHRVGSKASTAFSEKCCRPRAFITCKLFSLFKTQRACPDGWVKQALRGVCVCVCVCVYCQPLLITATVRTFLVSSTCYLLLYLKKELQLTHLTEVETAACGVWGIAQVRTANEWQNWDRNQLWPRPSPLGPQLCLPLVQLSLTAFLTSQFGTQPPPSRSPCSVGFKQSPYWEAPWASKEANPVAWEATILAFNSVRVKEREVTRKWPRQGSTSHPRDSRHTAMQQLSLHDPWLGICCLWLGVQKGKAQFTGPQCAA